VTLNSGHEHREQIGRSASGLTALAWLCRREGASEEVWRERFAQGLITVDGAAAAPERLLRAGEWLSFHRPPWEEPDDVPLHFSVLHEDEDLLAVGKPGGLPTMPAGGVFLEHTLLRLVQKRFPGATPLHRLGRATSGIVLFARTDAARSEGARALREHDVRKVYRALATGAVQAERFTIDAPIGEVPWAPLGMLWASSASGRASTSHVLLLERREGASLVEVEIETGRPHQIRIHLAHAGHPLVGDPLYGPGGLPLSGSSAVPGDGGYWLHAGRIELLHPRSGATLVIDCAPPEVLRTGAAGRVG
jgi:23S rRNA pseudouridine1911/1915/1917 synthase